MAIDIVDFPMKNGDFTLQTVSSPEGKPHENYSKYRRLIDDEWMIDA